MTVFTVGGVINTAEPLMLIVPAGDRLSIEAKIAPQDIDQARSHEEAIVRFPAFNQRTTPTLNGRVLSISADITTEPAAQHFLLTCRGSKSRMPNSQSFPDKGCCPACPPKFRSRPRPARPSLIS